MNRFRWCAAFAIVCISILTVDASPAHIEGLSTDSSNATEESSRHHLRSLEDASEPTAATKSLSQSSPSQNQANQTKSLTERSNLLSNWFVLGVWVLGVSAAAIGIWLVIKLKRNRDSFSNGSCSKTRGPSVTCRLELREEQDNSPSFVDCANGYDNLESTNAKQRTFPASTTTVQESSVELRSSAKSSVCSLADSDYVHYKSTLPVGRPSTISVCSTRTSLESDNSLSDESEVDEEELYSESMVSIDDMESALQSIKDNIQQMVSKPSPTPAQEPAFTISDLTRLDSGLPKGVIAMVPSPDGRTVTILYSNVTTEVVASMNCDPNPCNMIIPVSVKPGNAIGVCSLDYRAHAFAPKPVDEVKTIADECGASLHSATNCELSLSRLSTPKADQVKISLHTLDVVVEDEVRLNVKTCTC